MKKKKYVETQWMIGFRLRNGKHGLLNRSNHFLKRDAMEFLKQFHETSYEIVKVKIEEIGE